MGERPRQLAPRATAAPEYLGLAWRHGVLSLQRRGGMLGPLTFIVAGDRQVSPLYLAPWAAQELRPALSEVLQSLRGEWPCIPFGSYRPKDGFPPEWAWAIGNERHEHYQHGFSSNVDWRWIHAAPGEIELACRYPEDDDIEEVVRRVQPVADRPAVDLELTVHARRRTRLPVGLHFTFCRPRTVAKLRPGSFRDAWTFPGPPHESTQAFAPNRRFQDLHRTPASAGGFIDATSFPLAVEAEDLIQLNGVDGHFDLDLDADQCRISLDWNPQHFPSVLLWISNRGLHAPPWNGQHVALGIEPICSAFGLGLEATRSDNPLRRSGVDTVVELEPEVPFHTEYRISASALGPIA